MYTCSKGILQEEIKLIEQYKIMNAAFQLLTTFKQNSQIPGYKIIFSAILFF